MVKTKRLLALVICLAMIFSSLPLVALADDVPALDVTPGSVVFHEGVKFTGTLGSEVVNDSWLPGQNHSYCNAPDETTVNVNSFDYIEFDCYVEDITNFTARVSDIGIKLCRSGKSAVSVSYIGKITASGWNHIRIDVPRGNGVEETLKKCNQIKFVITMSGSATGADDVYKIANIAVTIDSVYYSPELGSTEGKMVLSKNTTFFGKYGSAAIDSNFLPGSSNIYTPNNAETDFTAYNYIEFDYYVKDLAELKSRVTSLTFGIVHYSGGADRALDFLSLLTKNGWNHIKLSIPKGTDRDWVIQRAKFVRFRITMPESNVAANDIFAVANVCVIGDAGAEWDVIPEMPSTSGVFVFATGKKFAGTLGSDSASGTLPGQSYPQIDFERMNLRNYSYIEFDYYIEDITAFKSRTSILNVIVMHYSGGTQESYNIINMITESGWNHIKIPISVYAPSGREWVPENAGNLRFTSTMTASSTGADAHYVIANIRASCEEWLLIPTVTESEDNFTFAAGKKFTGTLGTSAISNDWLPGQNYSQIDFDRMNLRNYSYIEFDYYIEDITAFKSRTSILNVIVVHYSGGTQESYNIINMITESGWNHIKIPISVYAPSGREWVPENAGNLKFTSTMTASSTGASVHYTVANIYATKEPAEETPVEEETAEPLTLSTGVTFSGTYGSSAVSNNLLPGSNSRIKLSAETDFSVYNYIEFDYYVENLTNLKARVTALNVEIVHYSDGAQQVISFLDLLTKDGWNHVKAPITTGTDTEWVIKRATRIKFRITMPASDTAATESYQIADIQATVTPSGYTHEETTPLIIASGTKFSGTYGSSEVSGAFLPGTGNISLSEEANMSVYDYIEFDYYVANITNLKARVTALSFQIVHYSWSSSQDTDFLSYLTKDGWNHVKFPVRKTENTSTLKRAKYFRIMATMPASSVAATDSYQIADIKATYIDYSTEVYDFNQTMTVGKNETQRMFTWISSKKLKSPKLILTKNGVETEFPVSERYSDNLEYYSYTVTVTGLTANSSYSYRIETDDYYSEDFNFNTQDFDSTFSFVQISDIQLDGDSGVNSRWLQTLDRINTYFPQTSLIVNSGDVSDRSSKNEYYQAYKAPDVLKSYVTSVVPGNHDSSTVGYDSYYSINFSAPDTYAVHDSYRINQYDYWHSYNNILFICLNSLIGDVDYHKDFVRKVVNEQGSKYDWIIVNYYSLFSASYHSTELATVKQRSVLVTLFNELGVDMVLSGHDHIYDRAYLMNKHNPYANDANYGSTSDGILYVSCTTGSGLKYNEQVETSIPYSAVTSAETYGFINYEVSEGAITMTFYSSVDMSILDKFTLFKDNGDIDFPEDTAIEKTGMLGGAENITFGNDGNHTVDMSGSPKNISADRIFETDVYVTGDELTALTVKLSDASGKMASYQFTGLTAGWNHLAARISDFNTASGFNKSQVSGMTFTSAAGANIVATNCYTADYVDGDANRDGVVDLRDIVRAKKMAADPTTEGNKLAVSGNDYQITAVDLTALVQSVINALFK